MSALLCDLDLLEESQYTVAARRAVVATRPPRRESPRFAPRRAAKAVNTNGIHRRGNKRCGV